VLDIDTSLRFKREVNIGEVKLATNSFGAGRGVYIAGLPYSSQNSRLLLRAMYWACGKENQLKRAFSSHPATDCTYYPESGRYAIINNSNEQVKTIFYDKDGNAREIILGAGEIVWEKA
jgi:1,3-beta-galactosyl-N-acetylhexosamine phosphorylase